MEPEAMITFASWLDAALERVPPEARALNFNLYEGDRTWDIELVGAELFDPGNPDWACDPVFSYPELCFLGTELIGSEWEQALGAAIEMISTYIRSGAKKEVLRSSLAVAVGFVDGDLTVLWPETAA